MIDSLLYIDNRAVTIPDLTGNIISLRRTSNKTYFELLQNCVMKKVMIYFIGLPKVPNFIF